MANKKAYLRLFPGRNGGFSSSINERTGETLRSLADEADKAYTEAKAKAYDGKVRAGFINFNPMHPDKIQQWELPEGTAQISIASTAEIEARKSEGGL